MSTKNQELENEIEEVKAKKVELTRKEPTAAKELQEVKLQGILLAEITLETSTKELLEIRKLQGHYTNFWVDNSGQRLSDGDTLNQPEGNFPLRLWRFPSKRDIDGDLVDQYLFDI
jgi:hypothetical protein